jgi:hypothetical protein
MVWMREDKGEQEEPSGSGHSGSEQVRRKPHWREAPRCEWWLEDQAANDRISTRTPETASALASARSLDVVEPPRP